MTKKIFFSHLLIRFSLSTFRTYMKSDDVLGHIYAEIEI